MARKVISMKKQDSKLDMEKVRGIMQKRRETQAERAGSC